MREHFNYSEGIVWGGGYEMQKCMRQDSVVEATKHKHLLQG